MTNPISTPGAQGIDPAAPAGFFDVPFQYPYAINLTSGQLINGDTVPIFPEADFLLRGLIFTSTGTFSIQFQDGEGYYLQGGLTFSSNLPNTPGDPFPMFPEVFYPAGGKIYINILDTSGDTNTGQFLFVGVSRYKVSGL